MDSHRANVRSVFIGLALAALSAGSLVAFSLVAGSADDPTDRRVLAARPNLQVEPVVVDAVTEPDTDRSGRTTAIAISGDAGEPVVLGTLFRNDATSQSKRDAKNDNDRENNDDAPADDDETDTPEPRSPSCSCEEPAKKNNTPNGHAYGHDKPPGTGLARGHDNSHAAGNGKGKGHK